MCECLKILRLANRLVLSRRYFTAYKQNPDLNFASHLFASQCVLLTEKVRSCRSQGKCHSVTGSLNVSVKLPKLEEKETSDNKNVDKWIMKQNKSQ